MLADGVADHVDPENRLVNAVLASPSMLVSEMVGKNAARAAPTLAFADFNWCSASTTSGRSSNTLDDRPAGTLAIPASSAPRLAGNSASSTGPPTSSSSALRSCATCVVFCATSACACASNVRASATSAPLTSPVSCKSSFSRTVRSLLRT